MNFINQIDLKPTLAKMITSRRPRNPIAKAVRTPLYKMRVVENKRKKLLKKWSEALLKDGRQGSGGEQG
ncbi:MAG: hypothetical protein RL585_2499 [Pseudomonadota bacterium]